ncbi:HU family DNA-binding protein [Bacillus cereus]
MQNRGDVEMIEFCTFEMRERSTSEERNLQTGVPLANN